MKVLIVDDEFLVIKGIQTLIERTNLGMEIVQADNGVIALEKVRNERPDIIITDVRMPIMDGLEFCSELKKLDSDVKIIIISGYEDFNYAKKAISLGAMDYVLKPIDQDRLHELLQKIKTEIEEKNKKRTADRLNRDLIKKKLVDDLIHETITADDFMKSMEACGVRFAFGHYFVASAILQDPRSRSDLNFVGDARTLGRFSAAAEAEIIKNGANVLSAVGYMNDIVLAIDMEPDAGYDLLQVLQPELQKQYGFSVTIGISGGHDTVLEISQAYHEAIQAVSKSVFGAKNIIYRYSVNEIHGGGQPESIAEIRSRKLLSAAEKALVQYIRTFDIKGCIETINDFKRAAGYMQDSQKNEPNHIITRIKQLAQENFAEIDLESAAKKVNISSIYLSTLFKEKTNENFKKYIMRLRLDAAKELLTGSSAKIYEIGKRVGYSDIKHFCKLFKKVVGMTPTDYRKKYS